MATGAAIAGAVIGVGGAIFEGVQTHQANEAAEDAAERTRDLAVEQADEQAERAREQLAADRAVAEAKHSETRSMAEAQLLENRQMAENALTEKRDNSYNKSSQGYTSRASQSKAMQAGSGAVGGSNAVMNKNIKNQAMGEKRTVDNTYGRTMGQYETQYNREMGKAGMQHDQALRDISNKAEQDEANIALQQEHTKEQAEVKKKNNDASMASGASIFTNSSLNILSEGVDFVAFGYDNELW